ncbi:hypothetical protein EHQ68_04560 [Leptospira congkakensis]|uniref:Uncharacterized protein n=1 Tax=Leptospira congkakensis TaxID=2484932 RepID=A0A4Z1AMG8_9LEPT|nr:hypothetical protein [Leptospira congkakensis]TGL90702.1 hypothetical protein EHQ69_12320 [Leptospira congkakensis]TGL91709.1 hypothetical protein EHQ68_04560 [Leptospira congkakensis]TGL98761.1 hypothetical protein EHQ70_04145 [Leptospira congkakensis]
MKTQSEPNVLGLANKIQFVIHMRNKFRILYTFSFLLLISCNYNSGIYDNRLITLKDAEKDLSILFIAKQLEYFPDTTIVTELNLSNGVGCKRDIYYDKSDFRRCLSNLALNPFRSKNSLELSVEFRYYLDSVCDLKKIIMFENSSWGGEINLCEFR